MKIKMILVSLVVLLGGGYFIYTNVNKDKVEAVSKSKVANKENSIKTTNNKKQVKDTKNAKSDDQTPQTLSWNGSWNQTSGNTKEQLDISNDNGKTFHMTLTVNGNGSNQGLDGDATISGTTATYVDQWGFAGCKLTMKLSKDNIHIEESSECTKSEQIGKYFAGDYQKQQGASGTNVTLDSNKVVSAQEDSDIQKLLGDDYTVLVKNMELPESAKEKYGAEDNMIIEGKTIENKEGSIIIMDPFHHYYIGSVIDGNKIRFYTNDEEYKSNIYPIVDKWKNLLGNYQVEFIFKKI